MLVIAAQILLALIASQNIKQTAARHLALESYQEASKLADDLINTEDAEAIYFAIQSYAGAGMTTKAQEVIDTFSDLLKEKGYYYKSLETLSLSVFQKHFQSQQEPLKLASLAAISQESDARVLDLVLKAFDNPSLKVKMLALRGLSQFADEKVKRMLAAHFQSSRHPSLNVSIARLFALWHDKRLLPILNKKIHEDALSVDEKISYIMVIKKLLKEVDYDRLKELVVSQSGSERLLATYLINPLIHKDLDSLYLKLLSDNQLLVKQSAVASIIKNKYLSESVYQLISSWKDDKSLELNKAFYYYGLVNHDKNALEIFEKDFEQGSLEKKKILASILYCSGPDHDNLAKRLIEKTSDPLIHLQLGLYLLSGVDPAHGVTVICKSLKLTENKKLFALVDPVFPFFMIENETNATVSVTAGHRRAMDKHLRLKMFHLLALKKMPEAKDILKQLLKTDLFEVSLDAMVHFWENFGYEDSEYLKNILNENDPELKLKAALVLSYLDYDKSIRKFLIDSFPKQNYGMQIQILFALSKYREDDVIQFYTQLMKSKYPMIQAVSAGCLFTCLYR
jgi:hypothetical protein